ncbi:hypothetical protein FH966_08765 [Lentibacillus cibarius]|uniref:Uncharacterized protein n=1 Tax=Lentibacillus cibarius TaxID=2583219 RepID=A0A549YIQ5_9BACI|nr:hypothetical protein [Lentibacillus cibarius]TMN22959.1 hypothetical protein FFL34_13360 [Lentibacillus cibarius]TRM11762.1 hypothetical protein FH966_08765 [Lentibacillus cibarius]
MLLVVLAYIADMFKKDIGVPFSSTDVINIPMLMTALFLVIVIGLFSLMMYFQTKKSDTFLRHSLWDKMYIIMPVIFGISVIIVFILFLTGPLSEVTQINRWIIYALIYYILFLINATVLAIVHNAKKNTISNENKIGYSFVWTSLGLLVVIFIL